MPSVHWNTKGDKAVVQAIQGISAAERERIETMKLSGAESRRLDRVATQTLRNQQTESGKLLRHQQDLNKAYATGKLTQEQYTRAFQESRTKMRDLASQATEATRRHTEVQRTAAEVLRRQETGQDRYNRALLKTGSAYRAGLITQKQFLTDAKRLKFEHLGGAEAAREAADAERERARALAAAARQEKRIIGLRESARQRMIDQGGTRFNREQAERLRIQQEGARVLRGLESAQARYNRQLLQTQKLRRAGALSDAQAIQRVRQLKAELAAAGQNQNSIFGPGGIAQLRNYALGVGGITLAIGEVRRQFQKYQEYIDRRAGTQVAAAGARKQLRLNLAGLSSDREQGILSQADALAGKLGLPQETVDATFQEAISGAPTVQRGIRFAEFGLNLLKGAEGSSEIIGGIQDIGNALNSDPETAAGVTLAALQRSRITDLRKFSTNAPRVVQAADSAGLPTPVALGVFNALTVAGADRDGEVSRTAAINLIDRLPKFFTPEVRSQRGLSLEESDEVSEQIALLRADPAFAKAFVDKVGFRAAGIGGIRGFLQGQSVQAGQAFDLTVRDLSNNELVRQRGLELQSRLNRGNNESTAEADRVARSGAEQSSLTFAGGVLGPEARAALISQRRDIRIAQGYAPGPNYDDAYLFARFGAQVDAGEAADFLQGQIDAGPAPVPRSPAGPGIAPTFGPGSVNNPETIRAAEATIAGFRRAAEMIEGAAANLSGVTGGDIQNPRQE